MTTPTHTVTVRDAGDGTVLSRGEFSDYSEATRYAGRWRKESHRFLPRRLGITLTSPSHPDRSYNA